MWSILSRPCPMNITGIELKASLAPLKKNPAEAGFFLFAWGRCEQAPCVPCVGLHAWMQGVVRNKWPKSFARSTMQ